MIEARMTDRELLALLSLLGTEDDAAIAVLTEQMRSFPERILRRMADLAGPSSPALKAVDLVLAEVGAPHMEAELRRWKRENGDLEEGMSLIARMRYPRLRPDEISKALDDLAREVGSRLPHDDAARRLKALIYGMHNALGFHGNRDDYYSPDNSYLNRVIETRLGLPISLTVVYILLGKRLGLDIGGVGLPGHFIGSMPNAPGALYFDPFDDGALLSLRDVMQLVAEANYVFHPEQLRRASPLQIVQRSLANLENSYERRHEIDRAASIQHFRTAL